ncbi:bifunctional phosphoribosylaminoimidazolecarboxamide formyltransferase/inosine monophosphate cyclohydrolase [Candidatus Woesearchaeota archaeon]|nr:bifunctional phosphoribosylaminoimidazolecarboxamide formyltransferase/inosine monophosphate cyclohydrolase [Candidatus Woesearchaeota archaeon]|tara:strand:+ start:64 stop:1602 length:1539 start_codon:yes stop_codon:yes gene_type:complete
MFKLKTALISVSDKKGIVEFAKSLQELDYKILSTGGTASLLKKNRIDVIEISKYTNQKEMLDGRIKSLHPKIFAGILALRDNKKHIEELKKNEIEPIDIVVVNLYPFEESVAKNKSFNEIIENIDIGGPSLIRASAKNFESTLTIVDPKDYPHMILELKRGKVSDNLRHNLALKAFEHTARYDSIINNYFMEKFGHNLFPDTLNLTFKKKQDLRYGENPHQKAAFYLDPITYENSIATSKQLNGKELSFNNILDIDNAFELVKEFKEPAAAVIKHTNPSGCAIASKIEEALKKAYEADTLSAFGSVIALNRPCNKKTAELINKFFVEVVICPEFEKDALSILTKKKNLRLLATGNVKISNKGYYINKVVGGLLVQSRNSPILTEKDLKVVSERKPTEEEIKQMLFAFKVTHHVKSNSIIFAKNNVTVGIGAGQMSRVVSVKIAAEKAGKNAKHAVMSSDAFFPFRDGIDEAAKAGITAIIQPGGSIRDEEVIKAVNQHKMAMVTTGIRLFWH